LFIEGVLLNHDSRRRIVHQDAALRAAEAQVLYSASLISGETGTVAVCGQGIVGWAPCLVSTTVGKLVWVTSPTFGPVIDGAVKSKAEPPRPRAYRLPAENITVLPAAFPAVFTMACMGGRA